MRVMPGYRNCEGLTRRDCLQLGLAGVTVGGFADLLRLSAQGADKKNAARRPTSCIMIWLDGGPSHFETFDPKPEAPIEIRGEFDAIATRTPGVYFSERMKELAKVSDKLCIVRSIRHSQGNHGA